jgi:shikimate kinase
MTTEENNKTTGLSSPLGDRGIKVFLVGFMGCGKTYWGRQLGQKLGIPFFDLDKQIEEKEGRTINEVFAEEGEEYFRLLEKDVLHLVTESHESFVLATGGGTPCYYNTIDYLKKQGTVIWINCSVDCLFNRLKEEKEARPLIKDLSDEQLHTYIVKKYADRKIYYEQATVTVLEENLNIETIINKMFHS